MKKYDSIHHEYEVIYYIPCFQVNPGYQYQFKSSIHDSHPSFEYSMEHATTDEQMAWAMNPDYVLKLSGKFSAKTQPFDGEILRFNRGIKNEDQK